MLEAASVKIKSYGGGVDKVIKKRCRRKVRIQPVQLVSRTLQKLFDSCRQVFKGPGTVPCPGDVQKLCHILARLAKMKVNSTFTAPCDTSVLYPTSGGNIHEFRAITPCAVLDVIGPPYSKDDGRDCSYYRETQYNTLFEREELTNVEDDESYEWLEEIEIPYESEMDGIEYMGPQIINLTS